MSENAFIRRDVTPVVDMISQTLQRQRLISSPTSWICRGSGHGSFRVVNRDILERLKQTNKQKTNKKNLKPPAQFRTGVFPNIKHEFYPLSNTCVQTLEEKNLWASVSVSVKAVSARVSVSVKAISARVSVSVKAISARVSVSVKAVSASVSVNVKAVSASVSVSVKAVSASVSVSVKAETLLVQVLVQE